MSTPNDGGPAFPRPEAFDPHTDDLGTQPAQEGMTLRDYFAAKAMQGWVSSSPQVAGKALNGTAEHADDIAQASYRYADAMLKARKVPR